MTEKENTKAIALKYDEVDHQAPVVKAKGSGLVADKIIQKANESEIPIYQDAALVEVLSKLKLGETIPEELYKVVAEVFAFIYQLDKGIKD